MKLVVIFPGIGYHCDKPILYYGKGIAAECGYTEVVEVNYTGFEGGIKGDRQKMEQAFYHGMAQAEEILKDIDWERYESVLFLSKSIGTIIANAYANKNKISCRNIYYTPLEDTFSFGPLKGIAFSGTADTWVVPERIEAEAKKQEMKVRDIWSKESSEGETPGQTLFLAEGTNHSLELDKKAGHCLENIDILHRVMELSKQYLLEGK